MGGKLKMSNMNNIKILKECNDYCPLKALYINLDQETAENLCVQYMDKNNVKQFECCLIPKEPDNMMYA